MVNALTETRTLLVESTHTSGSFSTNPLSGLLEVLEKKHSTEIGA
jgi:hypothetical protein